MMGIGRRACHLCRCRGGLRNASVRYAAASDDDYYFLAPTLARVQRGIQEKRSFDSTAFASASARAQPSIFIDGLVTSHLGLDPCQNARHAPMVYHERYSCPDWPVKHTFPMAKFNMTAESVLNDVDEFLAEEEEGDGKQPLVLSRDQFYRPVEAAAFPRSFLSPPICPDFLQSFLSGSLSSEECRLIGFREQTSRPELIERTLLEVAGTVLTAQLALRHGLASNLAGGTHHAQSAEGRGFTIVNDLAVTARLMTWKEEDGSQADGDLLRQFYRGDGAPVDRVLVVDCDVHQGDGTATFSQAGGNLHGRLFTLDLHASNNYPHPKEECTYDVGLPDDCGDDAYLSALSASLDKALVEVEPQLVLYNAGVDIYEEDKLGRLCVSWEGVKRRDMHVLGTCVKQGIPVAAVVGGGYDSDPKVVGRRHALVHRVCAKLWRESRMWDGKGVS